MNDSRTDSELVAAHLSGDRTALAGIYDRYAAALFDTSAAMLSDRHEAGDVMHDVFVVAAERLGQLRDPARLKPWLFAILRNEVYRRTKRRRRARPTDFSGPAGPEVAAPIDAAAEGERIAYQELAEMVRGASAGLDERDQLVLELSVRQGLTGADLADALGVTPEQSYVLVHRMRERVERALGALTVARMGTRSCPELATVLRGWDGTFSVLVRKRVARHVDGCEVCEDTKRRYAIIPLLGAAPAMAAPIELRESVLERARRGTSASSGSYGFDARSGFPSPPGRHRGPKLIVAAAAAAVVLLVGGGIVARSQQEGDSPTVAGAQQASTPEAAPSLTSTSVPSTSTEPVDSAAPGGTEERPSTTVGLAEPSHTGVTNPPSTPAPATAPVVTATPAGPSTIAPATTRPPTTTRPGAPPAATSPATTDGGPLPTAEPATEPTVSPTAPPTAPPTAAPPTTSAPTPGDLRLSASSLDLGPAQRSVPLTLSNAGQQPLTWAMQGGAAPFSTTGGAGGTLAPGQSTTLTFFMDRSGKEGDHLATYTFTSTGVGGGALQLRGRIERPPAVQVVRAPTTLSCTWTNANVLVNVSEESGLAAVVLSWSGPGAPGSTAMGPGSGGWIAPLGVQPVDGTWTWTATATDARGNSGATSGATLVTNCDPPR